ncbi:hypothetical protein AB3S75_009397 [Citrus x aurantiifolia]
MLGFGFKGVPDQMFMFPHQAALPGEVYGEHLPIFFREPSQTYKHNGASSGGDFLDIFSRLPVTSIVQFMLVCKA